MPASQLRPVLNDLKKLRRWMDLDNARFGEKLMDATASQIGAEMDMQTDPDGMPWAPLSEAYSRWKSKYFPGNPMAVLYGIMRPFEQLAGRRAISPHEGIMMYGTDEEAIEHASYFQDPENPDQPARRFYELSTTNLTILDGVSNRHFLRRM